MRSRVGSIVHHHIHKYQCWLLHRIYRAHTPYTSLVCRAARPGTPAPTHPDPPPWTHRTASGALGPRSQRWPTVVRYTRRDIDHTHSRTSHSARGQCHICPFLLRWSSHGGGHVALPPPPAARKQRLITMASASNLLTVMTIPELRRRPGPISCLYA